MVHIEARENAGIDWVRLRSGGRTTGKKNSKVPGIKRLKSRSKVKQLNDRAVARERTKREEGFIAEACTAGWRGNSQDTRALKS